MFYVAEKVLMEKEGYYIERFMDIEDEKLRFYPPLNNSTDDILHIDCLKITEVHIMFYNNI